MADKLTPEEALGKIVSNTSSNFGLLFAILVVLILMFILSFVAFGVIVQDVDEMEKIMIEYIEETEGLTWDDEGLIPIQEEEECDCCGEDRRLD